jgi:hypothetical protein
LVNSHWVCPCRHTILKRLIREKDEDTERWPTIQTRKERERGRDRNESDKDTDICTDIQREREREERCTWTNRHRMTEGQDRDV